MKADEKSRTANAARETPEEDEGLIASVAQIAAEEGWEAAFAVIEGHWDRLATSRPALLIEALSILPGTAFVQHPTLTAAVDYLRSVQNNSDPAATRPSLSPQSTGGDPLDHVVSLTKRAAQQRLRGEYEAAQLTAAEARAVAESAGSSRTLLSESTLAHLRLQWARCFDAAGSTYAISEYERAYEEALGTAQPVLARRAAACLAWVYAEEGRSELASNWASRARSLAEHSPQYDAPLYLAEALVAADHLDQEAAKAALEQLEDTHIGEYAFARFLARAAGTYSVTDAVLLEADIEAELPRLHSLLAEPGASLRQLTMTRAFLGLKRADHGAPPAGGEHRSEEDILNAVLDYRSGRPRDAAIHLSRWTGAENPPRLRSFALLLTGVAHLEGGHPGAAADALHRAHALIRHNGLFQTYRLLTRAHLEASFAHVRLEVPDHVREGLHLDLDTGAAASDLVARLTPREREMLIALTEGGTVTHIAARLHVSANTVKTTLRNVYSKLAVSTRAEAADIAFRVGIGGPDPTHRNGSHAPHRLVPQV